MALTETQQLYEAIKNSQSALITFGREHNVDTISSSLALSLLLKKLDKDNEIVGPNFKLPKNLSFLPNSNNINQNIRNLRKFIISLDVSKTPLDRLDYKIENNRLNIQLEPKNGIYNQEDLKTFNTDFKHNLAFVLNTPDLESLGTLYEENTDFFYHIPIINIDHATENEHFGHYNLINVTSTSIAEILFEIIEKIDIALLDEEIATCLLTGMIDKTKSFKIPQVTPKSLNIASQLIAIGARRDDIIKNLYQTKSINTLKLWGRVLLKLQTSNNQKFAWSQITNQDFKQTKTNAQDLRQVIDEMIANIPTVELTALIYQIENKNFALIKSEKPINLLEKLNTFSPQGNKNFIKIKLQPDQLQTLISHLNNLTF